MIKTILLIVVLVLLAGGAFFLSQNEPTQTTPQSGTKEVGNEAIDNDVNNVVVSYTDEGFIPNSITVDERTTVVFKNESGRSMWVASDPHPVHTDHAGFDQRGTGETYSFIFTDPGSYTFHNHFLETHRGAVIVE